ncbi:uncharacterized protein BDR25DRAFT_309405 [Lindgomyces ingoldianus]|uniref:Uncharacterized protein n=1 Tax=Lindgomyces ingoldianus TaxID=673940 RepID=A0ACB6RDI4_9PLEO|nr:uncharacterized protein BDR25DRAFT_309405 [Lindgomyces ingoldianus]KAF2477105.1 hypothetical protein BDR25DRAFT_309405 [Lindgomyces ingoldianus]
MTQFLARRISMLLLLGLPSGQGEPIDFALAAPFSPNHQLLQRDTNWTTQAFQKYCDNINYNDFSDCCTKRSGAGWMSCNEAGAYSLSGSAVLCYNLDAGHDCCKDNSVCDNKLGCCGDTCCQNDNSITVCEDGCISKEGRGCLLGTCGHGVQKGSTTLDSFSSEYTVPAASTHTSRGPSTADATATHASNTSPTSSAENKPSGGLSNGGIVGIAVSVGGTVITVLFGIGFKIWKYKQQKKLVEQNAAQEKIDRRNSMPYSPVSQPTWPHQPNQQIIPGGGTYTR